MSLIKGGVGNLQAFRINCPKKNIRLKKMQNIHTQFKTLWSSLVRLHK